MLASPCPIPAAGGVYGWYFDGLERLVPNEGCLSNGGRVLLYVGIAPKKPPANGRPASRQNLRTRVRYHFRGNAEGSTLRLTLGCLLEHELGTVLRRVGGGRRRTFAHAEVRLSGWMAEHARVVWAEHAQPWREEGLLISGLDLPLNLADNRRHAFHSELSRIRAEAKKRATELPVVIS